jgi:serine phosphatase RsbU (regulator of sigma subunit)
VTKSRIDNAGELLDRLRKKVKTALSQEGKNHDQKDGMDLSLCILDSESNILQFAGAYNPLIIVRKINKEVEAIHSEKLKQYIKEDLLMMEVKADRQPIAIHTLEKDFTNREIQLQSGDSIYMFSDGYADQIGGDNGKKFLSKNFRELLFSIQEKNMEDQKLILDKTFDDWIKGYDQIDDVLVLGIKV